MEYLRQRLRHGEMAVAGADLKGRLQTLYGDCGVNERNYTVEFFFWGGGHDWSVKFTILIFPVAATRILSDD